MFSYSLSPPPSLSLTLSPGNPGSAVILHNSHTPSHAEPDLSQLPELLVMDLRSYTAVLGNRAKGGGCECQGERERGGGEGEEGEGEGEGEGEREGEGKEGEGEGKGEGEGEREGEGKEGEGERGTYTDLAKE